MVRYMGYADLLRNRVSWVLSEERMMGIIVAPGFSFSSSSYDNRGYQYNLVIYNFERHEPECSTTTFQYACHDTTVEFFRHQRNAFPEQNTDIVHVQDHHKGPEHTQ